MSLQQIRLRDATLQKQVNGFSLVSNCQSAKKTSATDEWVVQTDKYFLEHQKNMQQWIKGSSIRTLIHETVGIDNAAEGLVRIFQGKNKGKALLKF